jgi:hypothetical protein
VKVRGAKVRADLALVHNVAELDAKKWRNSVPLVPVASACCACVPGLLLHLSILVSNASGSGSSRQYPLAQKRRALPAVQNILETDVTKTKVCDTWRRSDDSDDYLPFSSIEPREPIRKVARVLKTLSGFVSLLTR